MDVPSFSTMSVSPVSTQVSGTPSSFNRRESGHLRVLREGGVARFRADAQRRIYSLDRRGFEEADAWLERYRKFWSERLDDLERELGGREQHGRARKNRSR